MKRIRSAQGLAVVIVAMGVAGWILSACVGQDALLLPTVSGNGDTSPDADDGVGASDADAGDGVGANDADTGRTCDLSAPFTNVAEIGGVKINTSSMEAVPSLTSDEKTIVFTRLDGSFWHLYTATRASTDVAFDNPTVLTNLSGNWDDYDPWISASGDDLLFSSNRDGGSHDIYHAHRDNGVFVVDSSPLLPDWPANSERPFMTSDGNELFFSSLEASNAGKWQIFHSLNSMDGLSGPKLVPGLISDPNAYSNDGPVLSRDGLTMYFASDRTSPSPRIYRTERASLSDPFNNPVLVDTNLGVYNDNEEFPGWLSDDGCRLYFESKRSGDGDLFVASK